MSSAAVVIGAIRVKDGMWDLIAYLFTVQAVRLTLFKTYLLPDAWMDERLAILRSFQQYFSHIKTMGWW